MGMLHSVQFGHVGMLELLHSSVEHGRMYAYGAMAHEAKKAGNTEAHKHFASKSVQAQRRSKAALKSNEPAEKFNINIRKAGVGMGQVN